MEYNKTLYNVFSKGEDRLESWMACVFSRETDHAIALDEVLELLKESSEFTIVSCKRTNEDDFIRERSMWEAVIELQYLPIIFEDSEENAAKGAGASAEPEKDLDTLCFYVSLLDASTVTNSIPDFFSVSSLLEENYEEACSCSYALHVTTIFKNFALADYQRQLQFLNCIVPEASIFVDMSSCTAYSGDWLKYTSSFSLPPSFDYLYTIHAVYDDDTDPTKTPYWFHTHGLYRVGSIELEILGVESEQAHYAELLNTTAKLFIERGVPEEGAVISPAYGTRITWFPWEIALSKINAPNTILGGLNDRNDQIHNTPSGVLLANPQEQEYYTLDYYKELLIENPVFALSNFETALMRYAAKSQVHIFLAMFESNKDNLEDINFLVKLGYSEGEESNTSSDNNEHLWFEVHKFEDGYFDATLINEPYQDLKMHEGERGMHSIERLTDWQIYTPDGNYSPRNVYILF